MSTLFDSARLTLPEAIELTSQSLQAHGAAYRHWCAAYSGGKDSTATLTALFYLLQQGCVPRPQTLTVLYADTRMELPPLHITAIQMLERVRRLDWISVDARVVLPLIDDRFFVYMFGRGVPPPSNTFRWCTPKLKVEPMLAALRDLRERSGEKALMLTGVRLGESAARDHRISLSCGKNGSECGQGWFQETTPESIADTLAPILHWRTCHVWDWLMEEGDAPPHGFGLLTERVAEAYGGTGDHDVLQNAAARTGCVGCNLASQDFSLQRILRQSQWAYLAPLRRLKPLYAELKRPENRLRKDGSETRADGSLVANPSRLGPLTMDARRWGLAQVLAIQEEINAAARQSGRPEYSLIDAEEKVRIEELIAANTWPQRWSGDEPTGDELIPEVMPDGSVQHWLPGLED